MAQGKASLAIKYSTVWVKIENIRSNRVKHWESIEIKQEQKPFDTVLFSWQPKALTEAGIDFNLKMW